MLALALLVALQATSQTDTTRADSVRADSVRRPARLLESVQIRAIRGDGQAPISAKTVTRAELERTYSGQETPLALAGQPGITAYADNGAASNYTHMRLRGIDQTRINLTLDGVPLNEPEDQGFYFSNFPDFANSIESVQIQRGVGTSTYGVASYAGSVNFESIALASASRGGELQLGRGNFNTSRLSAEYRTGLTGRGLAGYGRFSAQRTDGYRYNSGNRSRSWFLSGAWFGARDVVKVTTTGGLSSNELAYLASPLSEIARDPRVNPLSEGENDRFHQTLVAATWTRTLSPATALVTTGYGFDAGGFYDVRIGDLWNFNLRSRWGGVVSALAWRGVHSTAAVGVHGSRYARDHWLHIRPDLSTRVYDNTGHKDEVSAFAKGTRAFGATTLFADAQLRSARFRYSPDARSGVYEASNRWTFVNPKLGVTQRISGSLSAFASVGMNGREPTRADMFAGADDLDSVTARSVLPLTRVRPESVRDLEAGLSWNTSRVRAQGNLFAMSFRNEIAPIGETNAIGYTLRRNVARSMRRGAEADVVWRAAPALTLLANASLTDARIRRYLDEGSGETFRDAVPLLTPKLVSNHGMRFDLNRTLSLDVDGRYTSRMMLTNTNDAALVVPPSYLADAGVTLRVGRHSVLAQLRNVANRRAYSAGYPDVVERCTGSSCVGTVEPHLFIVAPRSAVLTAKVAF